jgi:amino acid transporter
MCSFALLVKYFVDRFSLMRTWKRAPQLGPGVSTFSRRYFFSLACVAMAIISSFYWSGFPFDNICPNDEIDDRYVGKTFTVFSHGVDVPPPVVSFDARDVDYFFCNQDLLSPGRGRTFPFIAAKQPEGEEWMTDDQEIVTTIFGWSAVAITAIVILKFIWGWVEMSKSLFSSSYEVREKPATERFQGFLVST